MKIESTAAVFHKLGPALIVEDNALIAFDTQSMLEELGFSPVKILSALSDELESLAAQVFSFAILDLKLEDDASLQFAKILLERGTRFVFASGYVDGDGLPAPFEPHMVLNKPYTLDQLQQLIA